MIQNTEAMDRQGRKIASTLKDVQVSPDHRKHRRWINLVVALTRACVKQTGVKHTTVPQHRKQMAKLYNANYIFKNRRPA